jgi:hypothetical protein
MLYILVVVYNRSLQNSETLKGLIESSPLLKSINALVVVWDNSENASLGSDDITLLKQKFFFKYHHCPSNKPLSYVYNESIEKFIISGKYQYLVVLDHDSKILPGYFEELKNIIESNSNLDIILPVVKNNNILISPAKLFFVKGIYFKTIESGIYRGKLLAVNSGMAISRSFIEKNDFRYDARLQSYGTDNYIMNFANNKRAKYFIMNNLFEHGYAFYDNIDFKKKAEVFSQIKRANKIAFSLSFTQAIMITIYNLVSSFKNAFKHRSLRFFS